MHDFFSTASYEIAEKVTVEKMQIYFYFRNLSFHHTIIVIVVIDAWETWKKTNKNISPDLSRRDVCDS